MRGLFFLGLFGVLCAVSLVNPFAGVVAYLIHYHVCPERAYWGADLAAAGVRYSFTITACLAVGTLLNATRLKYRWLLSRQEILFLVFLAWLVVSRLIHPLLGFTEAESGSTDIVEKMLKLGVFVLILSHVVVTEQHFRRLFQVLVLCGLYLGWEAYNAPPTAYHEGRLNSGVGGPDFGASNEIAAHVLVLVAIIGVQFLQAGWKEKLLCLLAGAFTANTLVQTSSRGAFLGALVAGLYGIWRAPKDKRKLIWGLFLCALPGAFYLMDDNFIRRMKTMDASAEQSERSAQSRVEVWRATLPLIADYPLGVGPGNYRSVIGSYDTNYANRDTHNTLLRCTAELGFPGLGIFVVLIINALWTLSRMGKQTQDRADLARLRAYGYALTIALLAYLVAAMFGSYVYMETLWYCLLLPAGLERALANRLDEVGAQQEEGAEQEPERSPGEHGSLVEGPVLAGTAGGLFEPACGSQGLGGPLAPSPKGGGEQLP